MMKQRATEKRAAEIAAQLATASASSLRRPKPASPVAPPPPPPDTTLTNDSVLEMVKEKVPPDLILSQIRAAEKTNFDLSTPEVIRLTKGGVSPLIIEAVRGIRSGLPWRRPRLRARTDAQNAKQNGKQNATPPPTAANTSVPAPAATPAPVPIAAVPAPLTPAPAPAPVVSAPQTTNVTVPDGMPFRITLAADIPSDAEVGQAVRLTANEDFKVNNVTVIAKGAPVSGEISDTPKKKIFGIGGSKLQNFKLTRVEGVGGHSINVRALPVRKTDGATQRPVDAGQKTGSKDIAAQQGAQYIGYIDGEQYRLRIPK